MNIPRKREAGKAPLYYLPLGNIGEGDAGVVLVSNGDLSRVLQPVNEMIGDVQAMAVEVQVKHSTRDNRRGDPDHSTHEDALREAIVLELIVKRLKLVLHGVSLGL